MLIWVFNKMYCFFVNWGKPLWLVECDVVEILMNNHVFKLPSRTLLSSWILNGETGVTKSVLFIHWYNVGGLRSVFLFISFFFVLLLRQICSMIVYRLTKPFNATVQWWLNFFVVCLAFLLGSKQNSALSSLLHQRQWASKHCHVLPVQDRLFTGLDCNFKNVPFLYICIQLFLVVVKVRTHPRRRIWSQVLQASLQSTQNWIL